MAFCYWFFIHTPQKLQSIRKLHGLDRKKVFEKLSQYLIQRPGRIRGTLPSMLQNRWFKLKKIDAKNCILHAELRNLGHFVGIYVSIDAKEQITLRWSGDFAHNPSKAVASFLDEQISSAILTDWIIGPATFFPAKTKADTLEAVCHFLQNSSSGLWAVETFKRGQHSVELKLLAPPSSELSRIALNLEAEEHPYGYGSELLISWMLQDLEAAEAKHIIDDFIMLLIKNVSSRQRQRSDGFAELRVISWPSPQDFNEAIQSPAQNLCDEALQSCNVHLNALGLPLVQSGAFASVYRISSEMQSWALRCFLTPLRDQEFRYYHLSNFIKNGNLPYTIGFDYQSQGIRCQDDWFPILKMDWVEGDTLDTYIDKHIGDKSVMLGLSERFDKMMTELQAAGIAHGDLQHGNILVRNGELVLVDYDCMYIPALEGLESNELGHRNYQHPQRNSSHFGPYLDNFSSQVIGSSLKCLSIDPTLWSRLRGGDDCLLFRRADFDDTENSAAFTALLNHESNEIRMQAEFLKGLISSPPDGAVSISLESKAELRLT